MSNIAGKIEDMFLWFLDKGFNVDTIGHEIESKLNVVFSRLSEEAKQQGITLQLYSGSFDTTLEVLNEMNLPFKATVVALGGPSIFGSEYFFTGNITNPNIQRVVNIWGENDGFTNILGTVGQKNYTGADLINIEILGIKHTEYLNNSNNLDPSSLGYKSREFVNEIVKIANKSNQLYSYMDVNYPAISYNSTTQIYTVDLNKLYPEDNR